MKRYSTTTSLHSFSMLSLKKDLSKVELESSLLAQVLKTLETLSVILAGKRLMVNSCLPVRLNVLRLDIKSLVLLILRFPWKIISGPLLFHTFTTKLLLSTLLDLSVVLTPVTLRLKFMALTLLTLDTIKLCACSIKPSSLMLLLWKMTLSCATHLLS